MEKSDSYTDELAGESQVVTARHDGRRAMDRVLIGESQAIPFSIRLLFYLICTTTMMYALVFLVQYGDAASLYAENGLLEWLQIGLLLLCAIILKASAKHLTDMRQAIYLLSIMPVIASVREMDHILDQYVFDGAWQAIVSGLLIYMAYFIWLHHQETRSQVKRLLAIPPAGLFMAGFIAVMIFSRIFGQQVFWQFALQDHYIHLVARITEESCEIFGYLLLLFGSIELLVFAFSCKTNGRLQQQRRQPDANALR